MIENCASYGSVTGRTCVALAVGDWDKPKVNFTRWIENCFFRANAEQDLPLVGGEEGFVLTNIITTVDAGYKPKDATKALTAWAKENGYEPWKQGKLGDKVYPELGIFCQKPYIDGFMLFIR